MDWYVQNSENRLGGMLRYGYIGTILCSIRTYSAVRNICPAPVHPSTRRLPWERRQRHAVHEIRLGFWVEVLAYPECERPCRSEDLDAEIRRNVPNTPGRLVLKFKLRTYRCFNLVPF